MSNDIKSKIKKKVEEEDIYLSGNSHLNGLYIFFSYDLVNSTQYKKINPKGWPEVITHFYSVIKDCFSKSTNSFQEAQIWKYAGDEVLLYHKIYSLNDLENCLSDASNVLDASIKGLHGAHKNTKGILSIKAAVWCAEAVYIEPQRIDSLKTDKLRNIIITDSSGAEHRLDFLGPDVDVGFRISDYTHRGRIALSADLAYLLYKGRSVGEECLKIITYKRLKGVWGGRMYPIIWFENDWRAVNDSFYYDEHFDSELVDAAIKTGDGGKINELEKIFKDLNKANAADRLWEKIPRTSDGVDSRGEIAIASSKTEIEVHCVAVCFNKSGKILIAKRPETKNIQGGKWEFGCGQLKATDTFESCLKRSYQEDFNAIISFQNGLTPIRTYTVPDEINKRDKPGIIFIAQIENDSAIRPNKHDDIKWIDPSRAEERVAAEDCVPDFHTTVRLAYESQGHVFSPK